MTRRSGELVQWNNKGGYGFVRDEAGRDYYVHISKLADRSRPRLGDMLSFGVASGRQGRPSAIDVVVLQTTPPLAPVLRPGIEARPAGMSRFKLGLRTTTATAITILVLWAIGSNHAPAWLGLIYAAMGFASALLYRFDKLYAMTKRWRVSETNLHIVDLCCGIIGGLSAQEVYRHKTVKPRFVAATFAIALVHILGLAALAFGWVDALLPI